MITKETIKNSLSAGWHLHNLKVFGIIGLIYSVAMLFIASFSAAEHGDFLLSFSITGGIFLFFLLAVSPFVIYEIYSYKRLFKVVEIAYDIDSDRLIIIGLKK